MKLIPALVCALALGACTTAQVTTAHMDSEKAVIAADDLYVALATFANAQETSSAWSIAQGEALKEQAYAALLQVRALYAAGQAVDLGPLTTLAAQNGVAANTGS